MDKLKLSAYEIIEVRKIADIESMGYILRHKKSGARVCVISNEDDNKVFSIGFRTPPEDETGVPHIITCYRIQCFFRICHCIQKRIE